MPTINLFGATPPGPPTGGQGPRRGEDTLARQFSALEHRAGAVLTPTSYRNLDHATQAFAASVQRYQQTYGSTPNYGGDINALRGGLGNAAAAYSTQNISRLGSMAQRATDTRDWKSAAVAQHDLNRIEKSVREQLAFWRSPAQRANVQRQENAMLLPGLVRQELAIEQAKERISAARIGMSPAMAAFSEGLGGRGFGGRGGKGGEGGGGGGGIGAGGGVAGGGGFMGMVGGAVGSGMRVAPVLGGVAAVVAAAAEGSLAPSHLYGAAGSYIGAQTPYLDFDIETSRMGRLGGFNSAGLRDALFGFDKRRNPFNLRNDRMKALGMGPSDYMTNLQNYGVAQRSVEGSLNTAEDIRRAYMMDSGLSEAQVGQYLGRGRALGAYSGRPTVTSIGAGAEGGSQVNQGMNAYWNQYLNVTRRAVSMGLDQADVSRTMVALQSSQSANVANAGEMGNLFMRLASSGMPSMRTGAGAASFAEAARSGIEKIGTSENQAGSLTLAKVMGTFPTTEKGLQAALGVKNDDWGEWTKGTGQYWINQYLGAAQNGDQATAALLLAQVLKDHPETVAGMVRRAFPGAKEYQIPIMTANVVQAPLGPTGALISGRPGGGGLDAQGFYNETYYNILNEAKRRGLPNAEALAQLGAAQASVESKPDGSSDLATRSNNVFGIKSGTPGGVGESGQSGAYVSFSSRQAAASGWLDFITKNPRYSEVVNAPDFATASSAIERARYAEDPGYGAKVRQSYQQYGGGTAAADQYGSMPNQGNFSYFSLGQRGQQQADTLMGGWAAGFVGRDAEAVSTTFTGIVEAGRGLIDFFLRLAKQDPNSAGAGIGYEGIMTPGFGTPPLPQLSPDWRIK